MGLVIFNSVIPRTIVFWQTQSFVLLCKNIKGKILLLALKFVCPFITCCQVLSIVTVGIFSLQEPLEIKQTHEEKKPKKRKLLA